MRQIVILIVFALFASTTGVQAQNNEGKASDAERLAISPMVSDQSIPVGAAKMLTNKMKQLLALNNVAGDFAYAMFVMDAKVDVLTKEVTPTAPPMISMQLNVTFTIKDRRSGKVFAEVPAMVKGTGTNEMKAYMTAFRYINIKSGQFRAFVDKAKEQILMFYNSECDMVLSAAEALHKQGNDEHAMRILKSVPGVSKECFDKCMKMLAEIEDKPAEPVAEPAKESEPAADGDDGDNASEPVKTSGKQLEIDDNVFLVYGNMKDFGDKVVLYFKLENRGAKDYEFDDYTRDTRILDQNGIEQKIVKSVIAGKSSAYTKATLISELPVNVEFHFKHVDEVKMFEYVYKERKLRLRDLK